MKVLFLDVDGVLNHAEADWSGGYQALDPACVERVRGVCDRTGARIVVSSTWRGSQSGMALLLGAFGERIIGVTPFIRITPRHAEVGAWITQHSAIPLECVAVDDDGDVEGPAWSTVRTSATEGGLTEAKAQEIEAAFGRPPEGQ